MKLRNKKTGDILELVEIKLTTNFGLGTSFAHNKFNFYASLAELNENWEDYKPQEPLIKDEKIRKAVRAWAEANGETEFNVKGGCLFTGFKGLHKQLYLELNCSWTRDGVYTITELCGEEE